MKTIYQLYFLLLMLVSSHGMWGQKYEAESFTLAGDSFSQTCAACSGGNSVALQTGSLTTNITVATTGYFDIFINASAPFGNKINDLEIDGVVLKFPTNNIAYSTEKIGSTVRLLAGNHVIKINKAWGYINIDYLEFTSVPAPVYNINTALVTPSPSPQAVCLYNFLKANYGNKIISGVMEDVDAQWIKTNTGKEVALVGTDLLFTNRGYTWYDENKPVNDIIAQNNKGAISTLCWHWRDPSRVTEFFYSPPNAAGSTNFDITKINDVNSSEYAAMLRDIDSTAKILKKIQLLNIPILWRPLHEAAGGWFWWGKDGPSCKKLWQIMYDRLVTFHGINNLIWVWTKEPNDDAFYPGDEYVDIVGRDYYYTGNHTSVVNEFNSISSRYANKKMVTISECGSFPDPDNLVADDAKWSWFMVWSGDFVRSATNNSLALWKKTMAHSKVITLDEMPTNVCLNTVTNESPSVSLTSPLSTATFSAPASITIAATATDSDETISKVEFYQGTTLLGTDTSSPFSYTWTGVVGGTYAIKAKATDNQGGFNIAEVSVTVTTPTPQPDKILYDDALLTGWQDWSWTTSNNLTSTSPVKVGTKAAKANYGGTYQGFRIVAANTADAVNTSTYPSGIGFWAYGEGTSAVSMELYTTNNANVNSTTKSFSVPAGVWTYINILWADIGNPAEVRMIILKETGGVAGKVVNFDEIKLLVTTPLITSKQVIYDDALGVNWQNYSYTSANFNFANTIQVKQGIKSIKATPTGTFESISFYKSAAISPINHPGGIGFWAFGETANGTNTQVKLEVGTQTASTINLKKVVNIPLGVWTYVNVSWTDLGNPTSIDRINIKDLSGASGQVFYVDDVKLLEATPIYVSNVTFSPIAGTYSTAQNVTLTSATAGASIRYTIDGSTPTTTVGLVYSSPIAVSNSTTIKAVAYKTDAIESAVTSAIFTINSIATGMISNVLFCESSTFNVPFTITGTYVSGNIFTAQLSDNLGSFISPTTIGTLTGTTAGNISVTIPNGQTTGTAYRIRVISSNPSIIGTNNGINLTVNPKTTPTFTAVPAICAGATLAALPTTSNNSITGTWSPVLNNLATTEYTFTPDAGQCANTATLTITVILQPASPTNVTINTTICSGNGVVLSATCASGAIVKWYENDEVTPLPSTNIPTLTSSQTFKVKCELTSLTGCESAFAGVTITVNSPTIPTIPQDTVTVAVGTSVILQANGCSGTIKWFNNLGSLVSMPVSPKCSESYFAQCELTVGEVACTSPSSRKVYLKVTHLFEVASIITGGNWEDSNTWSGGRIPQNGDLVIIEQNHNVFIISDTAKAQCLEIRRNASLQYSNSSSKLSLGY